MRFSGEQRNILDSMGLLIDLYYYLKGNDVDQWYAESVIQTIGLIIYKSYFKFPAFLYYEADYKLYFPIEEYIGDYEQRGHIYIDPEEMYHFEKAIDAFHKEKDRYHFHVIKAEYTLSYAPKSDNIKDLFKFPHHGFDYKKTETPVLHYMPADIRGALKKGLIKQPIHLEPTPPPKTHVVFTIKPFNSLFMNELCPQKDFYPKRDKLSPMQLFFIESPFKLGRKNTLMDLVRFVFVKYLYLFESFDKKIKTCLYSKCDKMFVDNLRHPKKCCCSSHRTLYNKEIEPREVRLCRERQNAWMRSKLNRKDFVEYCERRFDQYRVNMDHCKACKQHVDSMVKSGECNELKRLNKEAIKLINEKLPPRQSIRDRITKSHRHHS